IDQQRIDHHLARQAERGGRRLAGFRQAHWDRAPDGPAAASPESDAAGESTTPPVAAGGHVTDPTGERERDDFAELRELLRAETAMRASAAAAPRATPALAPPATAAPATSPEPVTSRAGATRTDTTPTASAKRRTPTPQDTEAPVPRAGDATTAP